MITAVPFCLFTDGCDASAVLKYIFAYLSFVMNNSLDNANNETSGIPGRNCFLPVAHGIALITTNAIIGLLGTIGNLLVCVAVITNPRLRRASNYLLVSLAIADLIVTMVSEPVFVAHLVKRIGRNNCAARLAIVFVKPFSFSSAVSMAHLAAISVDRLIAVVYPLRHKAIMQSFGLKTMLSVSWILPIIVFILSKTLQVSRSFKPLFVLALFALSYAIVFVSYFTIVIHLVKQRIKRKQMSTSSSTVNFRLEVRVSFTLAIAIILFTASWFPIFIVAVISAPKLLIKPPGYARMWLWTVALSNSAMNFLIYGSRMRNFGDAYVEILRKILSCAGIKSRPKMGERRVRPQEEKNFYTPKKSFYETRL